MQLELLRLFNAVHVENKIEKLFNHSLFSRGLKSGFVLSPYIDATPALLDNIEKVVGISGEKANASFHKSWAVIKDSPLEQLVLQQIVHYITTYGFERIGVYSESTIYIPAEKLEVPAVTTDIPLTVIKAMNSQEILEGILVLAGSGIALSAQTLKDIMEVVKCMNYPKEFVYQVKNRELRSYLYEFYNIVPDKPEEYLRFLIKKLTGESLIIKNKNLIEKIKVSDASVLDALLKQAPHDLASIFFRYKPLFLAMKSVSKNKTFFNQLRKQANVQHKPLPESYLDTITSKLKNNKNVDMNELRKELAKVNIFRKIRLAYALRYRLNPGNAIVYKIRNGKGWVSDFKWGDPTKTHLLTGAVLSSIASDTEPKVKGKVIYIPSTIHYALPATEKQFMGNIPYNSYISVPKDMVVGVHWYNLDNDASENLWSRHRVDLDLSLISMSKKIGWDSYYYSNQKNVLFSGDMTNAQKPNGASELYYIQNTIDESYSLYVNYFNFSENIVPFKFFIAKEHVTNLKKDYMVNPNNIVVSINMNLSKMQNMLGMIIPTDEGNRFYFTETAIGNSISTRKNEVTEKAIEFYKQSCLNLINFSFVLKLAGAKIVDTRPEEGEYIDLSPENLDKITILNLLV